MSILKGILHHWNKTTKSYDTIHPETEVAQITDWNNGIVNTLASTALGTLVSTLTSDSLLALLIKKVFDATGVKYNIAQNGYVCLGSFYGGLIIQWVTQHINSKKVTLSYPVQFGQVLVTIAGVETATYVSCETSNSNAIVEAVWFDSTYPDTNIVHVIAIGQ